MDLIFAEAVNMLSIESLLIAVEFTVIQTHSKKFTRMCPKSGLQEEAYSAAAMGTGNVMEQAPGVYSHSVWSAHGIGLNTRGTRHWGHGAFFETDDAWCHRLFTVKSVLNIF